MGTCACIASPVLFNPPRTMNKRTEGCADTRSCSIQGTISIRDKWPTGDDDRVWNLTPNHCFVITRRRRTCGTRFSVSIILCQVSMRITFNVPNAASTTNSSDESVMLSHASIARASSECDTYKITFETVFKSRLVSLPLVGFFWPMNFRHHRLYSSSSALSWWELQTAMPLDLSRTPLTSGMHIDIGLASK